MLCCPFLSSSVNLWLSPLFLFLMFLTFLGIIGLTEKGFLFKILKMWEIFFKLWKKSFSFHFILILLKIKRTWKTIFSHLFNEKEVTHLIFFIALLGFFVVWKEVGIVSWINKNERNIPLIYQKRCK